MAELDLRVGGTRRVCMEVRTPNGPMRMWFTGEHREIVEPVRLVYTESMSDEHGNVLSPVGGGCRRGIRRRPRSDVELEDLGGRTRW